VDLAASQVTALQLACCTAGCLPLLLAVDPSSALPYLLQLPLLAYRGLRADQVMAIPPLVLAQLQPSQLAGLSSDAVAALLPAQIRVLQPGAQVAALNLAWINKSNGALQALTAQQMASLSADQWQAQLSCAQFNLLAPAQRTSIPAGALASFNQDCSAGGEKPPNPPPSGGDGFSISRNVFIISLVGTAVGVALLSALAYCCCLRRSRSSDAGYDPGSAGISFQSGPRGEHSMSSSGVGGPRSRRSYGGVAAHTTPRSGANYKESAAGLRQPLYPSSSAGSAAAMSPGGFVPNAGVAAVTAGGPHAAAVAAAGAPQTTYLQAEDDYVDDDDDDLIGSRF